jgi:hypothetical protein
MPLLEMRKYPLNSGWQCLCFQVRLEHPIEDIMGNAGLEPEESRLVMEDRMR